MYVCMCIHVYRQKCMGIGICMYVHKYTYYTHMYIVMDKCILADIYESVFVCIYECMYLSVYVCM